jgi:organic hydroperoxide reductase OsmC/OhrA
MSAEHTYRARCSWSGSTGDGYQHYGREHTASAPPAQDSLVLSADPAFLGRPEHLNPEQLVVLGAASCQLLSFLAVAARANIDVRAYEDDATGAMAADEDHHVRLTRIVLRPRIIVAPGATVERIHHLVEVAHDECYIANSLRTEVVIEPRVVLSDAV